jgi:predicted dehydrogenase
MIEAHRQAGTRLGGVFQNRFHDALVPLRKAIQDGRLGTITYAGVYVPWWRGPAYYENSWHGTWKLDGGGALMNQSIHMIDLLCELMGPVESVQAQMHHLGHPQIEAEDTAAAVLKFAGGPLGIIYGTTASYPGQPRRFEITGTRGTAVYVEESLAVWQFEREEPQDAEIRRRFGQAGTAGAVGAAANPAAISHQNHRRNFQAFLKALENHTDFCISGQEARKSVEVILAIYQSARERKIVKLA